MVFFLGYVGVMIYLCYYNLDADKKAIDIFAAFNCLSAFTSATGMYLKEAIKTENKVIASYGNC